jgi:hypothetical protein
VGGALFLEERAGGLPEGLVLGLEYRAPHSVPPGETRQSDK